MQLSEQDDMPIIHFDVQTKIELIKGLVSDTDKQKFYLKHQSVP